MSGKRAISDLAFGLWQVRGCPEGSSEVDWLEAERQVLGRRPSDAPADEVDASSKDSFPASDPPASHLPDVPPSNAADKWAAAKEIATQDDSPND